MKRIMIVALIISESILFADATQLARAVRVAKELRRYLLHHDPKTAPKHVVRAPIQEPKTIARPKSPRPAPKAKAEIPKAIPAPKISPVPERPNDRRYDATGMPMLRVVDQEFADQLREMLASGMEPAEIIRTLGISENILVDALDEFPPQPKAMNHAKNAFRDIEHIFYELRDDPEQKWNVILRRYNISDDELTQMLDVFAAQLAGNLREMDQQARLADDYDQETQLQNMAELFGLNIEEVRAFLQKYFPEEYVHAPVSADDWLAKNQPKQMPKVIVRDVQEQNPECIICRNDELGDSGVMYQTVCCGGKTFYCPTCLQGYEASLSEDQQSSCAACRMQPLRFRQFDIATGIYTQPMHEAKANQNAAKQAAAKLQQINQAKTTERRARLARGRYVNFGYPDFDAAYNQAMMQMQFADPAMLTEEDHNRAMQRRSQNPRFDQFVQDIINERFDGNMIEVGNNLLLLPVLSAFFDRYFDGRY